MSKTPKLKAYCFAVTLDSGIITEWPRTGNPNVYPSAYPAALNTNHLLSAQVDSNEPGAPARLKVDTTVIYDSRRDENKGGFAPWGQAVWGAERDSKEDYNGGHFWHLMRRAGDFNWYLWAQQGTYTDNDDKGVPRGTDGYYRNQITNYEAESKLEP